MRGAIFEQAKRRAQHADGGAVRPGLGPAEVLAEELVGAVDEMDVHARQCGRSVPWPVVRVQGLVGIAVACLAVGSLVACGDDPPGA